MTKVAALLSGGVDSSVATSLLREEGLSDITAFYLKIWLEDELEHMGDCPWQEDLSYAEQVCKKLGIKLEVVSLQTEYYEKIVRYVISELKAGRTPSPDVLCNQKIKFGAFLDAVGDEFDKVASGHYARLEVTKDLVNLYQSPDPVKDQTYFLAQMRTSQLKMCIFPLGIYTKKEIREIAKKHDLPTQNRPDSQGICFLGKIKYTNFIKHYLGESPGKIIEKSTGKVLGTHKGYWFHTIGQRKGLGLHGGPWFVVGKQVEENLIYVDHEEKLLIAKEPQEFYIQETNWIANLPEPTIHAHVKLRHGTKTYPCRIEINSVGNIKVSLKEDFDKGLASGQFAVFYRDQQCLGGGPVSLIH